MAGLRVRTDRRWLSRADATDQRLRELSQEHRKYIVQQPVPRAHNRLPVLIVITILLFLPVAVYTTRRWRA